MGACTRALRGRLTPPQVPALGIFEKSLEMGKFDKSRALSDGSLLSFKKARCRRRESRQRL